MVVPYERSCICCSSLGAGLNLWACNNKHGEPLQEMHLGRTVRSPLTDVRRGFGINIPWRGFVGELRDTVSAHSSVHTTAEACVPVFHNFDMTRFISCFMHAYVCKKECRKALRLHELCGGITFTAHKMCAFVRVRE